MNENEIKTPTKSYLYLGLITAISTMSFSQRLGFGYIFAYHNSAFTPFFSVATEIPQLQDYYGLLSAVAFNIPFAIGGLVTGSICDSIPSTKKRTVIYCLLSAIWSAAVFGQGYVGAFSALTIGRVLLGALQSFEVPFGLSLVDKWIPPN